MEGHTQPPGGAREASPQGLARGSRLARTKPGEEGITRGHDRFGTKSLVAHLRHHTTCSHGSSRMGTSIQPTGLIAPGVGGGLGLYCESPVGACELIKLSALPSGRVVKLHSTHLGTTHKERRGAQVAPESTTVSMPIRSPKPQCAARGLATRVLLRSRHAELRS